MLDIKWIRENTAVLKNALQKRGSDFDVEYLLRLDEKRRAKIKETDDMRARQNELSQKVSRLRGKDREEKIKESKSLKIKLGEVEFELSAIDTEFAELMHKIPNLPHPEAPIGKDASFNKVVRQWGEKPKFDFEPRDHVEIGEQLDLIDIGRAGKVVGARFAYLKREAVLLQFALVQFALMTLTSEKELGKIAKKIKASVATTAFIPVVPPVMIRPEVMTKMARLSEQDKDERYHLQKDNLYLVGSAEHTMGAMHMDEIFEEEDLPRRYIGFSTSFRREAGSYGQDTRGILRVHQFDKLEIESFTVPEDSSREQDFIVALQEHMLQSLGIPYQVVLIATGDMGAPDARQVDIECWIPSQGKYRETHTADLMTDYQARRLNTRVRRRDGSLAYVHMNDATAFAIGRTLIAILENFQQADGSVKIPGALRPYAGFKEILPR